MADKEQDLVRQMMQRLREARRQRPDLSTSDMLFSLEEGGEVKSIDEVNQESEGMTFVCMPCSVSPGISGSRRMQCARCFVAVWMSPATYATMNRIEKVEIVCADCFEKELGESK